MAWDGKSKAFKHRIATLLRFKIVDEIAVMGRLETTENVMVIPASEEPVDAEEEIALAEALAAAGGDVDCIAQLLQPQDEAVGNAE